MPEIRLTLINREKEPMMVQVEPEGADFWLLPDQEFELRAEAETEAGHFEVEHRTGNMIVYPSRDVGSISVFQNGTELQCGHNRPLNEQ